MRTVPGRIRNGGRNRRIEGWTLFLILVAAASIVMLGVRADAGPSGEDAYRLMIRASVRVSWAIFMFVFVASSLRILFPGRFSGWLLRNRRYVGLAFSATMLWQIAYFLRVAAIGAPLFPPVAIGVFFLASDLLAYALLLAMTVTSFAPVRRLMKPRAWRLLHKTGIFYLWFVFFYSFALGSVFSPDERWMYLPMFAVTAAGLIVRIAALMDARRLLVSRNAGK